MPELPEVETMRRGILPVVGATIRGVQRCRCPLRPIGISPRWPTLARRVKGRRILDAGRVGKRVVVALDSGDRLVFEPRMTGLVLLAEPPDREHLRMRFELGDGAVGELLYWDRRGLGSVRLVTPSQFDELYGPDRLGPDALTTTAEMLRARLGGSRRAIKVALLDQRALAGVGNLYASEMLHAAGLQPAKRCSRLTRDEWQRLHAAMIDVLETAIRYEGSTLSDGTYRNALNQSGSYQNQHRVYDRAGQTCPTCREHSIIRIVQAQRSTFYCPGCQPRRRRRQPLRRPARSQR